jgi:hypothetical protein
MFLATASVWLSTQPYYLVSGDTAIYLNDTQTVQAFKKVGVPVVAFAPADLSSMMSSLAPEVLHPGNTYVDGGTTQLIDGGSPNTVYYIDDFDGGSSTDLIDLDPPIDGNHS